MSALDDLARTAAVAVLEPLITELVRYLIGESPRPPAIAGSDRETRALASRLALDAVAAKRAFERHNTGKAGA